MLFNLFFAFSRFFQIIFPNKKMSKSPRDFVTLTKRDCCLYKANPQLLITSLLAEKGNLVKSLNSMQRKRFRIAWEMGRVSGNFYVPGLHRIRQSLLLVCHCGFSVISVFKISDAHIERRF